MSNELESQTREKYSFNELILNLQMGYGEFAEKAGITGVTFANMRNGKRVKRLSAIKALKALSHINNKEYTLSNVEGINYF